MSKLSPLCRTQTHEGFGTENDFIQLCLFLTHFCKINKTAANDIKAIDLNDRLSFSHLLT
jgi:hypothetical protein